jgi:hypothetical protein
MKSQGLEERNDAYLKFLPSSTEKTEVNFSTNFSANNWKQDRIYSLLISLSFKFHLSTSKTSFCLFTQSHHSCINWLRHVRSRKRVPRLIFFSDRCFSSVKLNFGMVRGERETVKLWSCVYRGRAEQSHDTVQNFAQDAETLTFRILIVCTYRLITAPLSVLKKHPF